MKIFTKLLALVAMTAIAFSAQAFDQNYYGVILKIQTNVSGAGKVYGGVGYVQTDQPLIGVTVNVDEEKIAANGADDVFFVTGRFNNFTTDKGSLSSTLTADADATTGATVPYGVGIIPNDGFTFLGWEDADGNILSTNTIADLSLHTSSYLGNGRSLANPKYSADNQTEYDILLTAKFEDPFTGIDGIEARPVASVKYVNLMGQTAAEPFEGVNIVVTTYNDGTQSTTKVIK